MTPLFSIVLPTRDRPEMLAVAVESVMSQTLRDWELIVVDDGGAVAVRLPTDPRVTLIRNAVSGGPSVARNAGLERAQGRFVAFLDDDDAWRAGRLANALKGHSLGDLVVCSSNTLPPTARRQRGRVKRRGGAHGWVLDKTTPPLGSTSVARALCLAFDERYRAAEDLDWWLRTSARISSIVFTPEDDWLWRSHHGTRHDLGAAARIEGSRQLLRENQAYFDSHRRALAFRHLRIGIMSLGAGDHSTAQRSALQSMGRWPSVSATALLARATLAGARGVSAPTPSAGELE